METPLEVQSCIGAKSRVTMLYWLCWTSCREVWRVKTIAALFSKAQKIRWRLPNLCPLLSIRREQEQPPEAQEGAVGRQQRMDSMLSAHQNKIYDVAALNTRCGSSLLRSDPILLSPWRFFDQQQDRRTVSASSDPPSCFRWPHLRPQVSSRTSSTLPRDDRVPM
jgi:hypothetical protein